MELGNDLAHFYSTAWITSLSTIKYWRHWNSMGQFYLLWSCPPLLSPPPSLPPSIPAWYYLTISEGRWDIRGASWQEEEKHDVSHSYDYTKGDPPSMKTASWDFFGPPRGGGCGYVLSTGGGGLERWRDDKEGWKGGGAVGGSTPPGICLIWVGSSGPPSQ